jgi:competence protein ComEA
MNRLTIVSTIAFVAILFGACTDRLSVAQEAAAEPGTERPESAANESQADESSGAAGEADEESSEKQSRLNPEVHDIYPTPGNTEVAQDDESSNAESDSSADQTSGVVNLNDASTEELMRLHGIGPAIAERIENYRTKRRFEKPAHIKRVRGVGEVTYQNLKANLAVEGETTLTE